jgi:DNA phosphorothioation-associated putative methyltransferase
MDRKRNPGELKEETRALFEKALQSNVRKEVAGAFYFYIDNTSLGKRLTLALHQFMNKLGLSEGFNIMKVVPGNRKVSFLRYPDFLTDPHPALIESVTINIETGKLRKSNFTLSKNPPILHRKELFVGLDHPKYADWKALTETEETAGLYKNTKIIGFKQNWESLLEKADLNYQGEKLVYKSDGRPFEVADSKRKRVKVHRHKTAIKRYKFSKPIQTAIEHDFINKSTTIFDYGCGRGDDLKGLSEMGIRATGWDLVHAPDDNKEKADVVNLGFVLNVIEDRNERVQVLKEAFSLADRMLIVSSMIASSASESLGRPYKDGILTSRNTFQKYFYQKELGEFIEQVLGISPVAVGLGIFYVFQNPRDHQSFLARRSRRRLDWDSVHRRIYGEKTAASKSKRQRLFENHPELMEGLRHKMMVLGRLPAKFEIPDQYPELIRVCGSLPRAKRFVLDEYGEEDFTASRASSTQDLLVYLALANFKHKVPWRELSEPLKLDIKAFFGNYKTAQEAGRAALFSIGRADIIAKLCNKTGFGHLDPQALYLHRDLLNELDPILRIYVGAAEMLYGDAHLADIIKIHKRSGKVTFLIYEQFEKKPLPGLAQRVKVNLKTQQVDVFEQEKDSWQQLLYFKERFVAEDHPLRPKWEKYSRKLRKIGLTEDMGLGPSKEAFLVMIEELGLTMGLNKRRKQTTKKQEQ